MAKPIPEGYRTVTPHIYVSNARQAIDLYKKAFGAEERGFMAGPDGKCMHAEIKIGDSIVMLNDEFPQWNVKGPKTLGGVVSTLHLYVNDVDASFAKATAAGCEAMMPPADMFWGDRYGKVRDPFGHEWAIATHKDDFTPDQMKQRAQEFFAKSGKH
jgi:PhnB protein